MTILGGIDMLVSFSGGRAVMTGSARRGFGFDVSHGGRRTGLAGAELGGAAELIVRSSIGAPPSHVAGFSPAWCARPIAQSMHAVPMIDFLDAEPTSFAVDCLRAST